MLAAWVGGGHPERVSKSRSSNAGRQAVVSPATRSRVLPCYTCRVIGPKWSDYVAVVPVGRTAFLDWLMVGIGSIWRALARRARHGLRPVLWQSVPRPAPPAGGNGPP